EVFGCGIVDPFVLVEHPEGAFRITQPEQFAGYFSVGRLDAPGVAVPLPHQDVSGEDGRAVPDHEWLNEMEGVARGSKRAVDEDAVEHHVTGPERAGACLHASFSITPRTASTASHTSTCR